jgi:hypothetical protein
MLISNLARRIANPVAVKLAPAARTKDVTERGEWP